MSYRGYQAARELAPVAAPPGRAEILRAVPPGARRICSRHVARLWPMGVKACGIFQGRRGDRQASILAYAQELAGKASYADGVTFHSREARAGLAGRSESTWKAVRRDLEAMDCLRTVRPGRIYHHGDQVRHDPAVYVLCLPKSILRCLSAETRRRNRADPLTRPPTVSPSAGTSGPAREGLGTATGFGPACGRARRRGPPAPAAAAAVAEVMRQAGGHGITEGWAWHIARKYVRAGWSAADIGEAIRGRPRGLLHRHLLASMRSPRRVLAWRLSLWDDPLGRPFPSPSQIRDYDRNRIREAAAPLLDRKPDPDPAASAPYRALIRSQPWFREAEERRRRR